MTGPIDRREQRFQIAAVQDYLSVVLPPEALVIHIPNQGKRSDAERAILCQMGMLPGIPDLLVLHPGVTLWFELKDPAKKTAAAQTHQRAVHALLRRAGGFVFLAHRFEDIEAGLVRAGIPIRGQVGAIARRLTQLAERNCSHG